MDKDVARIYHGILAKKRNEIVTFAETWMDLETVIQSEVSQKEENKYHIIWLYVESRKNDTDELICKAEIGIDGENKLIDTKRGSGV